MKNALELKPLLVAAIVGGVALIALQMMMQPPAPQTQAQPASSPFQAFGYGAAVGAIVQIGVRLTGVS